MSKTICIDAGHYGKYNQSPALKTYYESDMVWKLHLLLKKYLEQYGFKVITTRANQATDLALYNRGAKSKGCDLFLSIHSNAVSSGVNESVDYAVVYHLTEDSTTKCDDVSKAIAEKLAPVIADTMGTKQFYKIATRKASSDKNKDGILNDNYYGVLNGARQVGTPGLILEHSFHTNTRATKWLLDDDNLDKLAKAEAAVIAAYFGMTKSSAAEKTYYRVQVGAYEKKTNADKQEKKLQLDGFDTLIVNKDGFYKVQTGAYTKKENAEKMLARLKSKGYTGFITR